MTTTVLYEWFLLKIAKYIAQLKIWLAIEELRRLSLQWWFSLLQEIIKAFSSITGWRLILQVMKRIGCIVKTGLKYIFLELPVPALEILYILHFARAFLTLVDFFQDSDNKNLVEITKFLYACFKVVISLMMLSFLIVLLVHGMAPLGLMAYAQIKTLFRVYTFSKFGISLLTLGFSYYKTKSCRNDAEYAWLQAQYQANIQKHTHILVLGTLITGLLTLVSVVGFGLGPIGLAVAIVLGTCLLIVDIAKAIYFYKNGCIIPQPTVGSLKQKNSLIDFSTKDYYYRKCRSGRLYEINNPKDYEANKIYLLKEIVVKIIQLETKLKNNSVSRFGFFSEKPKIQAKIEGLKQLASTLLTDKYEANQTLLNKVLNALQKDKDNEELKNNKILILKDDKDDIENFINETKDNFEVTILDEILSAYDRFGKKEIVPSQLFKQSFFRKKGDCEDISDACQEFLTQQKPDDETVESRARMAAG